MTSISRTILRPALVLLLFLATAGAAQEDFPRPAELEPDVKFWLSVFTKYTSDEGVLHDNRNLAVVYERMDIPAKTSRRERQRRANARRKHYQAILRTLAGGKRDHLTAEEYRVLSLWPADVTNGQLKAAIGRIRFQQGLADRFRDGLQRSGRWRAHVNAQFTQHGVPVDLAALPHVESSYDPDARSHVGASGIWQFTRSTGRRFMQIDHVIDERNDPFTASEAAAKLLAYNYSIVGNWPMAITAYNHGLAGVRRAMRRYGDQAYTQILREYNGRTFGFASRNFYVAFLAAREVDQNPQKYFPGIVTDKPTRYATHELTAYVPAKALAGALDVTERELARHNLALQPTIWQGSKYLPRHFTVRIPESYLDAPIDELAASLSEDDLHARQLPDLYHRIARGDTLSEVADEYGTSVSTLVALNGLSSRHRIRAGQQLRLPAAGPAPVAVAGATPPPVATPPPPTPTPPVGAVAGAMADAPAIADIGAEVAAGLGTDVEDAEGPGLLSDRITTLVGTLQASLLSDPSDYTVAADLTIEVQPLETLGHYADWLGIRTQRLRDINGLAFRTPVVVGQRIRLDLGKVDAEAFENLRTAYHRQQQDAFFRQHTITGVTEHVVQRGESVWILALREYDIPVWLFRQYNPGLDLHNVQRGTELNFPVLTRNEQGS